MVDADELALLRAATVAAGVGHFVDVVVTSCAYSCCGRGWHRKDGYEQTYRGYVDSLTDQTFMLYSPGIGGALTYVVAVRLADVLEVTRVVRG